MIVRELRHCLAVVAARGIYSSPPSASSSPTRALGTPCSLVNSGSGMLKAVDTLSTLPKGISGPGNSCADVHVSPGGDHVYVSNRGHDSIAVFAFDKASGRMELVEIVSTRGKTPRNFAIDPSGNYLLAANQRSDTIVTFAIDKKSGKLKYAGSTVETPTPVCLLFHEL